MSDEHVVGLLHMLNNVAPIACYFGAVPPDTGEGKAVIAHSTIPI